MLTPADFTAPGPGVWTFDAAHQERPVPRVLWRCIETGFDEGFTRAFTDVGAMLERIETRIVHGWVYQCARPVGAPPDAKGSPPWILLKLMLMLHPELRRRVRRSEAIWAERPWREASRRWRDEHGPRHRDALLALQRVDRAGRDVGGLVEDARAAERLARAIIVDHMQASVPSGIPIGDLFVWAEAKGISPVESVRVLAGVSEETTRPARMLLAVREALEGAGAHALLDGPPADAVAAMAAHPDVGPVFTAWIEEFGYRAVDLDIDASLTLVEQPSTIVGLVRSALPVRHEGDRGLEAAAQLEARLPAESRPEWRARVQEAREAAVHRETSASYIAWALGLLRLNLLELGSRLASDGSPAEGVFHVAIDELDALPDAAELARRIALHRASASVQVPAGFGEAGEPPPAEWLPPGAARLQRSVMAYVSRFEATPDLDDADGLKGLGVSPGVATGQAFVLESLDQLDQVPAGCILVARTTTSAFNPVLPHVGGLVTEVGGLVCHAAIMARELGFPGVVGVPRVRERVPHGAMVQIDGATGALTVIDATPRPFAAAPAPVRREAAVPRAPERPGLCVPLAEAGDVARFGGKAAKLALAVSAGHRVPRGIALDVEFAEAVAAGDPAHLARLAEAVAALRGTLAVRSSAPEEDGQRASFAGQYHTELGVRGADAAAEAVATVWRSAWAPGALAYRERMGISGRPQMAVVVQELVPARCSGVRFGRDPVSGENTRILEGAPGLGATVVDGRVRPERARLDPEGVVLERVDGDTPVIVALDADGEVREHPVAPGQASTWSDADIRALHALGEACDALFGSPQDVEWAIAGDEVWLLQSRPVTTGGPRGA